MAPLRHIVSSFHRYQRIIPLFSHKATKITKGDPWPGNTVWCFRRFDLLDFFVPFVSSRESVTFSGSMVMVGMVVVMGVVPYPADDRARDAGDAFHLQGGVGNAVAVQQHMFDAVDHR